MIHQSDSNPEAEIPSSSRPEKGTTTPQKGNADLHISSLRVDYYNESLKIRLQNHEDDRRIALLNDWFFERKFKDIDCMTVVSSLFFSYPLLKHEHMDIYESLRQLAVKCYKRNPGLFRRNVRVATEFLSPKYGYKARNRERALITDNPIDDLDIVHTLQAVGHKAPLNRTFFTKKTLDEAVEELSKYDLMEFVARYGYAPSNAHKYYLAHKQ